MPFIGKLRLFAATTLLLLCMPQQGWAAPCPPDGPSLNVDDVPDDACKNFDLNEFGNMAWETFKTLVWPNSSSYRGKPDRTREITEMNGFRVFETYKTDWETFQENAAQPPLWDRRPEKTRICADADSLDEDSLVLASLHKFGNLDQIDFGRGGEKIFHVLVSQNRSLVRYLTAFNEKTFNTIRDNELYKPLVVPISADEPIAPRKFPEGSITIKSAWIEMDGISDERKTSFYTRHALVRRLDSKGTGLCSKVLVGLVALHIAHKTKSSPQWIWASFEHVKNVPSAGKPIAGIDYTFNNGDGSSMLEDPPREAWVPLKDEPFEIPDPFNVERQKVIPKEIVDLNILWQDKLKNSVWSNYELVAVQWPRRRDSAQLTGADAPDEAGRMPAYPMPPCGEVARDISVANTVVEAFLQRDTACGMNRTCMSCHNGTRSYDFIWSISARDKDASKSAISVLRQNIWRQRQ